MLQSSVTRGRIDYFCKYGGLAVVEINEQIKERPAICEDDQRNTTKDKIFYSHQVISYINPVLVCGLKLN